MDDLRRFTGQASILKNTLHRDNVGLHLNALANNPVERSGDLQGVRHSQTDHSRAWAIATGNRDDRKACGSENDNGTDEFESDCEPTVGAD